MHQTHAIPACIACLLLAGSALRTDALPAFPGAEGWGAETPGGRGGTIIFVTNLNDDGPGSLREALSTEGPRMILFRVSGIIRLQTPIRLGGEEPVEGDNPYSFVTVVGQSAPGGGVTIAEQSFVLGNGVHDVVLRHLRFRNARKNDGVSFLRGTRRIVMDHCSVSWATDENFGFLGDNKEITVQNCIVAEGLQRGEHNEGAHSKGMLVSRGAHHVSIHHCYMVGNVDRNPHLVGNNYPDREQYGIRHPVFDVRNNLVYNCKIGTTFKYGARGNVVGNVYAAGPDTPDRPPITFVEAGVGDRAYLEANIRPGFEAEHQWDLVRIARGENLELTDEFLAGARAARLFQAPPVTTLATDQVAEYVLALAGALPHDAADLRLIEEFRTKTGSCGALDRTHDSPIPEPAPGESAADGDDDGMPGDWERMHGLDPQAPEDAHQDRDGDGYTNLEEYLDDVANRLELKARGRL